MSGVFDSYAAFYDALYAEKDYPGEVAYVAGFLPSPEGARLIDLGCGTGRHAVEFARLGFEVLAIDLSEEMLVAARSRRASLSAQVRERLGFQQGDMRGPLPGLAPADAVVSLFHVVGYQTGNDDLLSAFQTVRTLLKPGGVFVFDFWNGPAVLSSPPQHRTRVVETDAHRVHRTSVPTWRPRDNVVDVDFTLDVIERATSVPCQVKEHHSMRYFFEPELDLALRAAGLQLEGCRAWLSSHAPGPDDWSALAWATPQV